MIGRHTGRMKVFIPLSDDMLETGEFPETLVPYQAGAPLVSQLRERQDQSRCSTSVSPTDTPNSDALPPLSSSTY